MFWSFFRPQRRRSRHVTEEVDEELAHHKEMLARDLELEGWSVDAAEHEAGRRFGNTLIIRRECIEVRCAATPQERAMLWFGLGGTLFGGTCLGLLLNQTFTSSQAAAPALREFAPGFDPTLSEQQLAVIQAATRQLELVDPSADRPRSMLAAQVLLALPAEPCLEMTRKVYARIVSPDSRRALLEPLVRSTELHPVLEFLDLAMRDEDTTVRGWASKQVAGYAFQDFGTDLDGYGAWFARHRALPLNEVVVRGTERYFNRLAELSGSQLVDALGLLEAVEMHRFQASGDDASTLLRGLGAWAYVARWLESDDPDVRAAALEWAKRIGADEELVEVVVRPALMGARRWDERTFKKLCTLHASSGVAGALADLDALARRRLPSAPLVSNQTSTPLRAIVIAMGMTGDPSAIHALLGLLAVRDDLGMCLLVGEALEALTEVQVDGTHDLAWWRAWWDANAERLPQACRDAGFPQRR